MRDITALRADTAGLATESASGSSRSRAARNTAWALVAELHAARALNALLATADAAIRKFIASALDQRSSERSPIFSTPERYETRSDAPNAVSAPSAWAVGELFRRDEEVWEALAALRSGTRPRHVSRTPPYRSHRIAAEAVVRSALWLA